MGIIKRIRRIARAGGGSVPCLANQLGGQRAIDDTQYLAHDGGLAGEQEAQWKGKAQHPWEDFSVDIAGNSQSDSDSSISWGAAVGWMFAEQLGVQADATRIDSDIHYWNLGLVYRF